jgi:hypothetical protein
MWSRKTLNPRAPKSLSIVDLSREVNPCLSFDQVLTLTLENWKDRVILVHVDQVSL